MRIYMLVDSTGAASQTYETDQDIYALFGPDLIWVDITDANPVPQPGWLWDGSTFSPPPPPYVDPRPPLLQELEQIDRDSARPLRVLIVSDPAIGIGTPERQELEALEQRAIILRAQLAALDE